ncbi:MAG: hypothetical protein WA160_17025 [Pseudobdellovibrio sp.]
MAKKTSSSSKKMVKKTVVTKSKTPAKPLAKAVVKAVAKSAAKSNAKLAKVEAVKGSKKVASLVKSKDAAQKKPVEKAKPALLNKKTIVPEIEETSAAEELTAVEEVVSQKAEKAGKVKPIRIEKGNAADEKAKWIELSKKQSKEKAVPYKMSDKFTALSPIQHKVLGWGFILSNDNDRLEVLFETGIRMLISNYKT